MPDIKWPATPPSPWTTPPATQWPSVDRAVGTMKNLYPQEDLSKLHAGIMKWNNPTNFNYMQGGQLNGRTLGQTEAGTGEISINPLVAMIAPDDQLNEIMAHELQHKRQYDAEPHGIHVANVLKSMLTPYQDRPQEVDARAAATDATKRLQVGQVGDHVYSSGHIDGDTSNYVMDLLQRLGVLR